MWPVSRQTDGAQTAVTEWRREGRAAQKTGESLITGPDAGIISQFILACLHKAPGSLIPPCVIAELAAYRLPPQMIPKMSSLKREGRCELYFAVLALQSLGRSPLFEGSCFGPWSRQVRKCPWGVYDAFDQGFTRPIPSARILHR